MGKPKPDTYPRACPTKRCHGYGLYWIGPTVRGLDPFPMSSMGYEKGFKSVACPACGANPHPNGKM